MNSIATVFPIAAFVLLLIVVVGSQYLYSSTKESFKGDGSDPDTEKRLREI